jgi:hypothetical protein
VYGVILVFIKIYPATRPALIAQRGGPKSPRKNNFVCPVFQERTRTKRHPRRAKIVYQDNTKIYRVRRHVWIASLDGTHMESPLLNVWIVIQERTLLLPALLLVIRVATMNTNRNPMLRSAYLCKKGTTGPVQQPKSNARRVKQDVVATLHVKIVKLDRIKVYPATPRATNAPLDGRLKTAVPNAPPAARARLAWIVKIAQWGLHEKETTMRPNANDATQV